MDGELQKREKHSLTSEHIWDHRTQGRKTNERAQQKKNKKKDLMMQHLL
jgi:hypothetical protein